MSNNIKDLLVELANIENEIDQILEQSRSLEDRVNNLDNQKEIIAGDIIDGLLRSGGHDLFTIDKDVITNLMKIIYDQGLVTMVPSEDPNVHIYSGVETTGIVKLFYSPVNDYVIVEVGSPEGYNQDNLTSEGLGHQVDDDDSEYEEEEQEDYEEDQEDYDTHLEEDNRDVDSDEQHRPSIDINSLTAMDGSKSQSHTQDIVDAMWDNARDQSVSETDDPGETSYYGSVDQSQSYVTQASTVENLNQRDHQPKDDGIPRKSSGLNPNTFGGKKKHNKNRR